MTFKPGREKTGGRGPGTLNKRTRVLQEALEALEFDVPTKLVELVPRLPPEKQADVLLQLMVFIFPKRKAVEIDSPRLNPIIEQYLKLSPQGRQDEIERLIDAREIIKAERNHSDQNISGSQTKVSKCI